MLSHQSKVVLYHEDSKNQSTRGSLWSSRPSKCCSTHRIQRACLGREDICVDRMGSLGSRLDTNTHVGHLTLSNVRRPRARVPCFCASRRNVVWRSCRAHAPERKAMSGVVEVSPGVKDQMPSTPGRDVAHDDVSDDVPRGWGDMPASLSPIWGCITETNPPTHMKGAR